MQPRIKIFNIPGNLKVEHVDDYINSQVVEFLADLGQALYNPKTLRLAAVPGVGFVLHYDSTKAKTVTSDMFIKEETINATPQEILQPVRLDNTEPSDVEKLGQVSKGLAGRHGKTNKAGATKR